MKAAEPGRNGIAAAESSAYSIFIFMRFQVGQKVGDYEFLAVVEATQTGVTYRVQNLLADRPELLKVLPPDLQDDPERVNRFLREAKIHARLHHPNIAAFYNATRVEGQLVMTSELVEGASLEQRIGSASLPLEQAAKYFEQALSALSYAHREGVVHRDIKPGHLIITADDNVKITGFGLAKKPTDPQLTQPGIVMGSVHYMSPEQVKGSSEVDRRSDIYSLGVVLYEAVTGKKPFDSKSQFEVFLAHVNQEPEPPSSVRAGIPRAMDQIILTAMAKQPASRFQTAEEFRDSLTRLHGVLGSPAAATGLQLERPAAGPGQEPERGDTAAPPEAVTKGGAPPPQGAEPPWRAEAAEMAETFSPPDPAPREWNDPTPAQQEPPASGAEALSEAPSPEDRRAWQAPQRGNDLAYSDGGQADTADEGVSARHSGVEPPAVEPSRSGWEWPGLSDGASRDDTVVGSPSWASETGWGREEPASAASSPAETAWTPAQRESPLFAAPSDDAWPENESTEPPKEIPLLLRPSGGSSAHGYSPATQAHSREPEASSGSWFGEQAFVGWTSKDILAVGVLTFVIVAAVFFALLTFLNR